MAKRLRKRAISIVLMLTMVFTLFPTMAINAYAAEDIEEYSLFAEQQEELVNGEDTDYSEYEDEQENEESVEVLESEMSLLGTTYSSDVYINALATGDIIEPTAMVQGVGTEFNVYIDDVLVNSGYQWINQGGTYTVSSISENSGVYSLYLVSDARTFVNFSMVMCNMPEEYDFTTLPEGVTFSGTWNSDQHGYRDFTITVPVDGPVRFTIGDCRYAKNAIPVKNNANETITTLSFPASGCYGPTTTGNVFQYIYTGGADTLKFDSIQYCNYFAAEAVDYVEVTGVSLNTSAETLTVGGDAATLTATIEPAEATDKTVKWSVDGTNADAVKLYSDADCTTGNEIGTDATETLTVYAKGISAGSATVTVTSNADSTKCASCEVTVNAGNTTFNPASTYTGFGDLISNDTEVNISEVSGKTWYVIANDGSTVTLLSKQSFGSQAFNSSGAGNDYNTSEIKTYVDGLTGEGQPLADISSVISNLTLIDTTTAQGLSVTKKKGAGNNWWLRSSSSADYEDCAACVYGANGYVDGGGVTVNEVYGVRPALKLDLSKVEFDSSTNTFSVPTPVLDPVSYLDAEGKEQICASYTVVKSSTNEVTWNEGWYVVNDKVTIKNKVIASGDIHLILCDNSSLTIDSDQNFDFHIDDDYGSLTVYSQSFGNDMGSLNCIGAKTNSIKVGNSSDATAQLTINGGNISAKSISNDAIYVRDNITINNGIVDAVVSLKDTTTTKKGRGIYSYNGNITINGGTVTASGYYDGIKSNFYSVIINGGTVNATSTSGGSFYGIATTALTLGSGVRLETSTDNENWKDSTKTPSTRTQYMRTTYSSHIHNFTYSASGATITATCSADGCELPPSTEGGSDHVATLTIAAPESLTYDGNAKAAVITDANSIQGEAKVQYQKKTDGSYGTASETAPTDAGDYKAGITLGEGTGSATASVEYTIAKATPSITASPTASEITYGQKLENSTLTGGTASVEGTFAWKDNTVAPAVSDSQTTEYDVVFTPTDGNYNAAECKVKLTVNKAESSVTKDPDPKTLIYSGSPQELVTAGTASGGTMNYALGTDDKTAPAEGWESSVPTGTDAKTYYVWYKVKGDANHSDSTAACVSATITDPAATVSDMINALPAAADVTTANKAAIEAARAAYEALTDEQKTQVGSTAEDKLKAAEVALTKALIAALPSASAVKSSDAEAVATAKNLYDSLTDDQKEQVTVPEKNKLDAVVEALSDAEVYDVRTMINDLPAPGEVTAGDEAAINKAREAYEKLSDAKKAFVGETSTGKLIADETVIAIIKLPAADKITLDDKETVVAIREAYDSLTDAQKEEIGSDKVGKLEEAEAALKAIEDAAAANSVKDKIDALPAGKDVTVAHKGTIEEARAAYNALTDDQQKLITKETLDKLEEAEEALAAAEAVYSVTSIKLRAVNGTTMIPGSSQEIEAAITPSLVSASQLIWSSSNENVATVTGEGKVEVKKDIAWGEEKSFDVTITAKSTNGVEGSVTITVKTEAEKTVTAITIDPKSVKTGLKPGDTFRLTAMTKPADATDKTVVWSSSDEGIAQVGPTGIVTITGTGKATITVKAGTDDSISAFVDLVIDKKDVTGITINTAGGDCLVVGSSAKLSANVTPSDATYQGVKWSSSDPEIAAVDEDGTVTAKAAGKVTITAASADPANDKISASKEYIVFENDDSLHVEFAEGSEYYYTGRAITPDVDVYYHGKPLLRDTDYTVSYKYNKNANDASNVKKAPTVKVTGKTVAATAEATFKILPVDIGDEELVTAEELSVAYGKTVTPLLYYGGTRLTGSDITNNHAKFRFTESRAITVYGKGNFTGEREIWVNVKSSAEIKSVPKIRVKSFKPANRYYNGQEQPLNAKESAEDNDNEIVVVSAADKSKTPKELVLGEDFYIAYPKDITNVGTVRIAVIGMGDYTGTVSKTYKILAAKDDTASIKGMDITFRDPYGNYTIGDNTYDYYEYQPGGVYPYVEVVANYQDERSETLVAGRDYKVTFANNRKAGEINDNKLATATITFKGNYKSLKKQTKEFFITRADMSAAAVNLKNRIVTKANAKYPISAPVVDVNEVTVKKSEYKVTYKVDGKEVNKNTKVTFKSGEPVTVTVEVRAKAKGNYTGTAIGKYTVTLSDSSKDLSKAKAIIQKKGDISHKAVKNLKFTGGEIRIGEGEYADYELYVYTGKSAKNPTAVLKEGTDYVATYSNNVKAGTATVVLNAVEREEAAYFGSKTFSFKIVKGSMPWFK